MVELGCIPFGAGHADEGVCLLLNIGPYRILLDCGLHRLKTLGKDRSPQRNTPLTLDQPPPPHPDWPADLAICSHAHADHARGFWELHRTYPYLPIYASEVTADLLAFHQPFTARGKPPTAKELCQTLTWRSPIELYPNLTVELYPAGHLPGAAVYFFTYTPPPQPEGNVPKSYTVLYTGDFLISNSRLVEGLPLSELRELNPDVLILEGSFGTSRHPHRRQQENQFAAQVLQALQTGFSVLLPVPVIGLGQELLMLMRSHHTFTGQDIDIWVEESIALGCDIYLKLLPHLPPTVQNFARHQSLFWDERIRPRVRRLTEKMRSHLPKHPCVFLASESADIRDYCTYGDRPWVVLIPEHLHHTEPMEGEGSSLSLPSSCSVTANLAETLQKWKSLSQDGQLTVNTYLLAEHCDGSGTTQLIHNLRPQHVVFVHGSPTYLDDLISLEELSNRYHLHSPRVGNYLELPIGDGLIQPEAQTHLDRIFDGELHEQNHEILVALPSSLREDPRWQNFADTGLVEASWQGEMLLLRRISQQDLLVKKNQLIDQTFKGCAICQHYRGQRCWNPASSLYSFKVAPDGYCLVFESRPSVHPDYSTEQRRWGEDEAQEYS